MKRLLRLFGFAGTGLRAYLRDFRAYSGGRAGVALALLLLAGFIEGVGLLLLIPLLSLTGFMAAQAGQRSGVTETLGRMLDYFHIGLTLSAVLAVFCLVIAFEAVLTRQRGLYLAGLEMTFTDHLRNELYAAMGRAEWLCHLRRHSADAMQLLDDTVSSIGQGTYSVLQLAVLLLQGLVYLLVALQASPAMTLAMLVVGLALLLLVRPLNRRAFRQGEDAVQAGQAMYRSMSEFFAGMKVAKSFGREQAHVAEFQRCTEAQRASNLAFQRSAGAAQMGFRIASALVLSGFVYYAVTRLRVPAEVLIVLIFLSHRLFGLFSSAQHYWQYVLQMLPSYAHYSHALQTYRAAEEHGATDTPDGQVPAFTHALCLQQVCFRYQEGDANRATLQSIDLEIPARRTVALVGPSGAGKSTLADIILGLLQPDSGRLLVDGRELTPDLRRAWRRQLAYVPQEVYLFHESIRDNLLRASPEADEASLWLALRLAAADEFVRRLPGGLDCRVGDRGVRLSGGERQRIALARALLRQPGLLILDEATSALDMESERQIHHAIGQLHGKLTILIIAHRLSTVRDADHIVVMEGGRVVEAGNWQTLARGAASWLGRMMALHHVTLT